MARRSGRQEGPKHEVVRQEVARAARRQGDIIEQRRPDVHESAHADEDAALVAKVAPMPQKYNYRSPCFRDLQTQNAYLRGQLAKVVTESKVDSGEADRYKEQVHELTVHRAVLHRENERLLQERKAVELAAQRTAASQQRTDELVEQVTRLKTELQESRSLNDSLRAELHRTERARELEVVGGRTLMAEVSVMERDVRDLLARVRRLRGENGSTGHQLEQAHALLRTTQEAHSSAKTRLEELSAQHEAMRATFRSQAALTESLQQQVHKARADARGTSTTHDELVVQLAAERESHVGSKHQLSAAQMEVERLQQKLDWLTERAGAEQASKERAEKKLSDAMQEIQQLNARMALYSQWVGVGSQDAVKVRQWAQHDKKLRGHLFHERQQHDSAWFRMGDLQAGDRSHC